MIQPLPPRPAACYGRGALGVMNTTIRSVALLGAFVLSACAGVVVEESEPTEIGAAGAPAEEIPVPTRDACDVGDQIGYAVGADEPHETCARMATRKGDPVRWCCLLAAQ